MWSLARLPAAFRPQARLLPGQTGPEQSWAGWCDEGAGSRRRSLGLLGTFVPPFSLPLEFWTCPRAPGPPPEEKVVGVGGFGGSHYLLRLLRIWARSPRDGK